jgi:hypothetical protein
MTRPVRAAAHIWPGGTPDYRSWRAAVLRAEELHVTEIKPTNEGYDFSTLTELLTWRDANR